MSPEFKQSQQAVGQEALFAVDELVRERPVMRERAALSRMLTSEAWGVSEDVYTGVTREWLQAVEPKVLRKDLIGCDRPGKSTVTYPDHETRSDIRVSLTPAEYTLLPRNIDALGKASLNRTLAARPDIRQSQGAAVRSVQHTFAHKYERIQAHMDNKLIPDQQLLEKFKQAGDNPGLSMFGQEVKLRIALTSYRQIMDDAITAIGSQRGGTYEQRQLATRACEWRILFERQGNKHIGYFKDLTDLLLEYNGVKQAVFKSRIMQLEKQLKPSN